MMSFINDLISNPSRIRDKILNEVGRNETHVCNAYPGQPYIWLYFHAKPLKKENLGEAECYRVLFGKHKLHKRSLIEEYMTAMAEDADGNLEILFYNNKMPLNRSYIVTRTGDPIESNYKTSKIWHDYSNNNYEPSEAEIKAVKEAAEGRVFSRPKVGDKYSLNMSNINIINSIFTIDSDNNLDNFHANSS